jgi:alkylated DNA nucleotide flippase Atl1
VDDEFVELVLSVVEQIPAGKVATYGDIAEIVGRGGPRQVGSVMSRYGAGVPWWRVIRADGRPVSGLEERAMAKLAEEGAPVRGDRIDLRLARFAPPD